MLTVVTPAANRRLTTIERAWTLLGFQRAYDKRVDLLIDQASEAIVRFCAREFARSTVQQVLSRSNFRLAVTPVVSISSVSLNGAVLGPSEFSFAGDRLAYTPLPNGLYGRFLISGTTVVTYQGGYIMPGDEHANLPADVERAAILVVGAYLSSGKRDPMIRSESSDGVSSVSFWGPSTSSGLPSQEAEQLLRPYGWHGLA